MQLILRAEVAHLLPTFLQTSPHEDLFHEYYLEGMCSEYSEIAK